MSEKAMTTIATGTPVSVVREIFVRPGQEAAFEAGMSRLIQAAVQQPGHLGTSVVRPVAPGSAYRFLYKFDSHENLERWHNSEIRAELWKPLEPLTHSEHMNEYPGLETWFDFPTPFTPLKWKTTLVSWLAIYPVALLISYGMAVFHFEAHILVRVFVLTALVVPTVAYLVAPRLSKLLHAWLHAGAKSAWVKRHTLE